MQFRFSGYILDCEKQKNRKYRITAALPTSTFNLEVNKKTTAHPILFTS